MTDYVCETSLTTNSRARDYTIVQLHSLIADAYLRKGNPRLARVYVEVSLFRSPSPRVTPPDTCPKFSA